jgi:hypothetical protein
MITSADARARHNGHMPAIADSTRSSITLRLLDHAETHWPQLERVQVSYRGAFAYVAGVLRGGETIPLCRLRYGGSAHSFGFAIYSAAHDRYQDAVLVTGLPIGTPQEALDTACTVHRGQCHAAREAARHEREHNGCAGQPDEQVGR